MGAGVCLSFSPYGSCGERTDDDTDWSANLVQGHPHLGATLNFNGLGNLEFCALGTDQFYYARWKGGNLSYWATDEQEALFEECTQEGHSIIAASFGYGHSIVLSYGFPDKVQKHLGYAYRLQGYYPVLANFLRESGPLSIAVSHAIGCHTETQRSWDGANAF